jgi:2-C-methyl-D-erythritol 4-phosphate cytidylyltransferase
MSKINKSLFAVIVAGGSGNRMKNVIPKQFLPLFNKPILSHTLEVFLKIEDIQIVVVLPEKDMLFWEDIVESNPKLRKGFKTGQIKNVTGGATRYKSVNNGLKAIEYNSGLVAIHDGVRPLITKEKIELSFKQAQKHKSAILAVSVKDSVRKNLRDGQTEIVERSELRLIQTPQTFNLKDIKSAYTKEELPHFTDDASVFEADGHIIHLIDGDYDNIKITTPEDLIVAEALMKK